MSLPDCDPYCHGHINISKHVKMIDTESSFQSQNVYLQLETSISRWKSNLSSACPQDSRNAATLERRFRATKCRCSRIVKRRMMERGDKPDLEAIEEVI